MWNIFLTQPTTYTIPQYPCIYIQKETFKHVFLHTPSSLSCALTWFYCLASLTRSAYMKFPAEISSQAWNQFWNYDHSSRMPRLQLSNVSLKITISITIKHFSSRFCCHSCHDSSDKPQTTEYLSVVFITFRIYPSSFCKQTLAVWGQVMNSDSETGGNCYKNWRSVSKHVIHGRVHFFVMMSQNFPCQRPLSINLIACVLIVWHLEYK